MKNHYESNKFQNMFVNTLNIVLLLVLVASIGLAFVSIYALIFTAASLGVLAYRVIKAIREYPKRVQAAQDALSETMNEIGAFRTYVEEQSRKRDDVLSIAEFL